MSEASKSFAVNRGKTTLYKFRPFSSDEDRRRVVDIIANHKVYFARPSQLNDPFDLSPRLAPFTRQDLLSGAHNHLKRNKASVAQREKTLKYLATCDLKSHAAESQAKARNRMESYPVFSLAGNRSHPMLWSHYADSHTGVCLHFRSDAESIFGASMQVEYSNTRPLVSIPFETIPEHEFFKRIALSKGEFWKYEEEFRFLAYPGTDFSDVGLHFEGQLCRFPSNALIGVTVGARMPPPRVSELLSLAANHNPPLPVWRAVETDTYDYDFEVLSSSAQEDPS